MVVGFITSHAISAYHHQSCEFEPCSFRGVLDTTCDNVCQWLVTGRWFSPGTLVSSTNKYDITEILLKVTLNTITMTPQCYSWTMFSHMILYMFYRHIWREIPMWVSCIAQHMTLFWAHNAKRIASQCENIPKTNHFPWVWKILNLW